MFALLVPVVALMGLWTLDVSAAVTDATAFRDSYNSRDNVSLPCDRMVAALQTERRGSVVALALGGDPTTVRALRTATDARITEFQKLSRNYRGEGISADITRDRIAGLSGAFDSLSLLRKRVDTGDITRAEVVSGYAGIISYAFTVYNAAAVSSDPLVERVIRTGVALRRSGELLHQENALLSGVTIAGRFADGEYRQLIEIVGAVRFQIPTSGATLPGPDQADFKSMLSGPAFTALRGAEDQLIRSGTSGEEVATTPDVWAATFTPAVREFYGFLANGYDKAAEFAKAERDRILWRFGVSGLLGLLAIVASLLLAVHIGGSVVRRLSVLRAAATDLAHRRLPDTVRALRAGERVAGDVDPLRLSLGDDEIAQVGAALSEVQRSAIDSAAGEAALRYDMKRVLVNIARRNQTLIDRQLEALAQGTGERAAARAGQLAAQMRRQADHLVILAGSARSGRRLGPQPLAGIVTRVAGEVEHAERIEIGAIADAEVPGAAVTDIGHLLAELLANGTTFSPPETTVRVSAHPVPDGIMVEVEDHGLGMSAATLDETNRRLAQQQMFNPATSSQLDLLVVAQLAAQHGISVVLRPAAAGGITAEVTIPAELAELAAPSAPAPAVTITEPRPSGRGRRSDASRLVGMASRAGRGAAAPRHAADDRT